MANIYNEFFSNDVLTMLNELPEVVEAREKILATSSTKHYFSIPLTPSVRTVLEDTFNLNLSSVSEIPMRWIKGDTAPHIDRGASQFNNTYLVYLTDSVGDFVLEDRPYPIQQNTAFVFNEGMNHETINTGDEPRLLLGPMNEFAQPVGGAISIYYYSNQFDAENFQFNIGFNGSPNYIIGNLNFGSIGSITSWRIASNSTGTSSQAVVYTNGNTLNSDGDTAIYHLYPNIICFLEGTKILCEVDGKEEDVAIEDLKVGTLVKTSLDGFKKVVLIGKGDIKNPGDDSRIEDRLYKLSPSAYPDLKEDLFITGCHSILEFPITDSLKEKIQTHLGKMFVTDKKYRVMAHLDERAVPWNSEGRYPIYHFALENADDGMNYGVYANGLLVETSSIRSLKNKSNMNLTS